jgi:hypothetical protein
MCERLNGNKCPTGSAGLLILSSDNKAALRNSLLKIDLGPVQQKTAFGIEKNAQS